MSYVLEAPVIENRRFPRHNYILALRVPEIAEKTAPGQFVMAAEVSYETLPSPLLKRALAVYSIQHEKDQASVITLLLKIVGDGTRRLASLQPGDCVSLIGPLGNGFDLQAARGKLNLVVVGGTGIASVYLLCQQLTRRGEEVRLLYGGKTGEDLVGLEDFEALDIPITVTTEDGSRGRMGLITDALEDLLQRLPPEHLHVFTCGPNPMMRAVTRLTSARKVPSQISVEAKMACGFGVCLGCTVKTRSSYRLACRHGPVFRGEDFLWEGESA